MEPAVRYDFSFPPKSSSINNNNMHSVQSLPPNNSCGITNHHQSSHHGHSHHSNAHNIYNQRHHSNHHSHDNHNGYHHNSYHNINQNNNNIGLSKSASTSLLSCVTQNNNTYNKNNSNFCNSCNTKDCTNSNSNHNNNNNNVYNKNNCSQYKSNRNTPSQYTILPNTANSNQPQTNMNPVVTQNNNNNNHPATIGAPATPKDGNCSFTFDDLKNTLAFMEDSPLINTNTNSNGMNNNSTNNPNTSVLMVIPNIQPGECTSSLSSSSSSSSGLSSSSCNSCCAPGFLTKSNSNPMLLSAGSSSSSSASPNSVQQAVKSECGCAAGCAGVHHQHQQYQQTNSVLDLLIKKSPSDLEKLHHSHQTNYSSHNSLITTANNLQNSSSLLTSVHSNSVNQINTAIETAAKKYRSAAQISEATCCWKGKLPAKQYKTPIVYSTKVFVGGLPWDITEEDLIKEFGVFGPCRVEWTNKEKYNLLSSNSQTESEQNISNNQSYRRSGQQNGKYNNQNNANNNDSLNPSKHRSSPGFAYVIYESEYSVKSLVGNCIEDYQHGRDRVEYYFKISTRRVRNKEVQIIPWILADNNFALCTPKELDPKKTVFVGNLHGTMTARDLAHIMNELFGCVVYAGIDIDKLKYPIGSGRVTFSHQQNFMRAVRAAFVDIQSSKFSKRIQIDPYLEDVQCCLCYNDKGIYFCRDFQCFNYYCGGCWDKQHSYNQLGNHKPLMRKREDKA